MKSESYKRAENSISRRYWLRTTAQLFAWALAIPALAFLGWWLLHQRIWFEWEPLYQVFKFLQDYILLLALVLWFVGIVVILALQWRRVGKDFTALAGVIDKMSQDPDSIIALPENLRELEEILRQVQREAQDSRRAAAEAEQRKNDLVVYLAHDLKTPLTSVIGYLNLMRDEEDITPDLAKRYLSIAADKAQRLEDLINEFFEITRFNLKGLVLEKARLNISRMLEQIVDEFRPIFAEKDLACSLQVPPGIEMLGDAGKLERVLDNLLRNAVSYSYPGSEVQVRAAVQDARLCIEVQNSGPPIPPHKLERVFEQFFRMDSSRSGDGGAGLGLAIAKEIVELHGGAISVTSSHEATVFTVCLPNAEVQQPA